MAYQDAIRKALSQRYRVDAETGVIYGPKGPLVIKRRGRQRYPTVSLSLNGEPQAVVPAHKIVTYALYGEQAFAQVVRHLDGDTLNLSPENLRLGSTSDNELDKSKEVRRRAAKAARAAQGPGAPNSKFTPDDIDNIRAVCERNRNPNGRLHRGIAKQLGEQYGVTNAAISAIAAGRNYSLSSRR